MPTESVASRAGRTALLPARSAVPPDGQRLLASNHTEGYGGGQLPDRSGFSVRGRPRTDIRIVPKRPPPAAGAGHLPREGGGTRVPRVRTQLTLMAVSSITNEVCFSKSSLPVNFRVIVLPM